MKTWPIHRFGDDGGDHARRLRRDREDRHRPRTEKCYGVAQAGKNDCAVEAHGCKGQALATQVARRLRLSAARHLRQADRRQSDGVTSLDASPAWRIFGKRRP